MRLVPWVGGAKVQQLRAPRLLAYATYIVASGGCLEITKVASSIDMMLRTWKMAPFIAARPARPGPRGSLGFPHVLVSLLHWEEPLVFGIQILQGVLLEVCPPPTNE